MEWDKLFKRYVWDDDRTPYLVPVARLTQRQAGFELKAYTVFLGFLFAVVSVVALAPEGPMGRAPGVSVYCFTMVCAALVLGLTKAYPAALYCASAPPAALMYFYVFGFHPNLAPIDHLVILTFVLLWAVYALRVLKIGRRFESMPPGQDTGSSDRWRWQRWR